LYEVQDRVRARIERTAEKYQQGIQMNSPDGAEAGNPRRSFLLSSGGWLTSVWIAAHWPAIAAAAHHAAQLPPVADPVGFQFFTAADAADVEAIAGQIMPSGATPGARETHAVNFIDRGLATFFSAWAADFRAGLSEFQAKFIAANSASPSFAAAASNEQIAYLKTVDSTSFFGTVRVLTLLGIFSSPKYGGNYGGAGWAMMGFKDQHAFTPPFG